MAGDDDQLIVFERQLRAWQDRAAALGHPATALMVPRDSPDHPSNEPGRGGLSLPSASTTEHVAIAGAVIVGGLVLLAGGIYVAHTIGAIKRFV